MTAPTLDTYVPPPGLRQEPERDDNGRPYIIRPDGGRTTYARPSSYGKHLEDDYNLQLWKQRQVLIGGSLKPEIMLDVAAHRDTEIAENKKHMNEIVEQAHQAAGSYRRSQLGTAIHKITETYDAGGDPGPYPVDFRPTIEVYRRRTDGFTYAAIEQFIANHEFEAAGTADRFRILPDGRLRCVDLKTGRSLEWSYTSYCVQVALYTSGQPYDLATGTTGAWPVEMDLDVAELIHLPVGEGRCEIYELNIREGVEAAREAMRQRLKRNEYKRNSRTWVCQIPWTDPAAPTAPAAPAPAPVTVFPGGETGQLIQTAAGPQIATRPHSQAPASPPAPGPVVTVPDGVVNPATGEVHAQADDAQPAGAAVLALLRQVFATIGAPWPAEAGRLTNLDVRKILTHWDAVQLDAAEGKLEPGQTPAAAMVEFLIGGGLVPDGTLAQPRVPAPGGPTMPTLAVPAAPAGPSAADVLAWIPQAPTEADLTALWQQYGGTPLWDARHDGFAGARFQQLQAQAIQQAADLTGQHLGATSAA